MSVLSAQLPAAVPSVTLRPGTAVVDFDASASNDADGEVLRWEWYFGDGEMALGQTVSHLYRTAATFDATLVVRDNDGGVATASSRLNVPSVDVDSDGDGVNDSVDCAPLDPGSRTPVTAVTRLYAVKTGPAVTLTWDDQAPQSGTSTVYDLLSGSISNLRTLGFDTAASCLESDVTRDDDHPIFTHHVFTVTEKERLGAYGCFKVMHIFDSLFRIDIFNTKEFLGLRDALIGNLGRLQFFVYRIVFFGNEFSCNGGKCTVKILRFLSGGRK